MQVILLQRIAKLGQMGDVVNVKQGFARNYLLPQGKALRASEANMKAFEAQKTQLEMQNIETRKEAAALAERLDGTSYVVIRSASDGGALYGSVSTRDVADAASEAGFSIDRRQVVLENPIKTLGLHSVTVVLNPEVSAQVTVNVARSAEEAERQASGKTIQELAAEEEAAAEFEISGMLDDIGGAASDDDSYDPRDSGASSDPRDA